MVFLFADRHHFHGQVYFTLLGKFDGVANQIGQDLRQAGWVTNHRCRHIGHGTHCQFQPLLARLGPQQMGHTLNDFDRLKGDLFDRELARLDLGKIEDIVDDPQQRLGSLSNLAEVIPCTCRQKLAQPQAQMRKPEHGVDGRADFMAHIGQETGARFCRRVGGFQGILQARHGGLVLGYVVQNAQKVNAVVIHQFIDVQFQRNQ